MTFVCQECLEVSRRERNIILAKVVLLIQDRHEAVAFQNETLSRSKRKLVKEREGQGMVNEIVWNLSIGGEDGGTNHETDLTEVKRWLETKKQELRYLILTGRKSVSQVGQSSRTGRQEEWLRNGIP